MKNSGVNKIISGVLIIVVVVIFGACNKNNAIFEKTYNIIGEKWYHDSLLVFDFEITDTVSPYDILFHIRNTGDYRFQNLLMYINFQVPDNKVINDTVNCILAEKKGKWIGSGWGSIWSRSIIYKRRILFPRQGEYRIVMEHAMRTEELKAITDIGIKIVKSDK